MKKKKIKQAKGAALDRFVRVVIPQLPALFVYLAAQVQLIKGLPVWVPPLLAFGGAVATALDKFVRDMGGYKSLM